MNFVSLDFETANSSRSSACSLGIVEVMNGRIITEQSWLINPKQHFDRINIGIHGITPEMVANKPTFKELWPTILQYIQGKSVVAHNASFDMSVLRYCLDADSLKYPSFDYFCTYLLSKGLLQNMPSHKLNIIAEHYGIELDHHDALSDARAAAALLLKLMEQEQINCPVQLSLARGYKIGKLYAGGYTPFSAPAAKPHKKHSTQQKEADIQPVIEEINIIDSSNRLIRGQKTDVTKYLDAQKLLVEVEWDLIDPDIEIDSSAFLLYETGRCERDEDCIFYGNPDTRNGSISYSKLNSNKAQFKISFDRLPIQIQKISFTLSIYEGEEQEQYFSQVSEINIRLINPLTGHVIAKFEFGEDLSKETAIVISEMYLYKGDWKFNPIGKGYYGGLRALCQDFGLEVREVLEEVALTSQSIAPKVVYDYDEAYYIGHNVERIRRCLGYTQKQLATLIGYKSANPISRLERGELERFTHEQLVKIAEVLKVNLRQLLTK